MPDVIEKNILGPGKKAVVIYGDLHFYNNLGLRHLVEKQYPNAFFIVAMYAGYATKSCTRFLSKASPTGRFRRSRHLFGEPHWRASFIEATAMSSPEHHCLSGPP
jgi:hypothetical protein